MRARKRRALLVNCVLALVALPALAQNKKPNILVIMGDDIGWFNLGSYNSGIMLDATPNLDKLASEGMRFTDYYAESSCTDTHCGTIHGGGFMSSLWRIESRDEGFTHASAAARKLGCAALCHRTGGQKVALFGLRALFLTAFSRHFAAHARHRAFPAGGLPETLRRHQPQPAGRSISPVLPSSAGLAPGCAKWQANASRRSARRSLALTSTSSLASTASPPLSVISGTAKSMTLSLGRSEASLEGYFNRLKGRDLVKASVITPKPARHDHLKTGQATGSGQLVCSAVWSSRASILLPVPFILALPGRRIRQRRDATGAPTQRPGGGAAQAAHDKQPFWRTGDKSQGFRGRSPQAEQRSSAFSDLRPPHSCGFQ